MEQAVIIEYIKQMNQLVWGWPLLGFLLASGIIMTIALQGIQFRYFFTAWKLILLPSKTQNTEAGEMTPFQAFVNALSSCIGNGALAGMATAIAAGGPGAAFWVFILGFLMLPIRYAEVYASTAFASKKYAGPMAYLALVPGGSFLPALYALFCLLLTFVAGNAMQTNSMGLSLCAMTGMSTVVAGLFFLAFLLYVMLGGARRIIQVSDMIVPVKVGLFFITSFTILFVNYAQIIPALILILKSAVMPQALYGALTGYTVQNAFRFAAARVMNATEMGIGTAGVLFGATGKSDPVRNGIMSMVSAFISNYFVCFVLCLCFIVTGTWNGGAESTAMTIAAYSSVFGALGGWIVTFLGLVFGMGVIVSYAFIGKECWLYLTGGRWFGIYAFLYCAVAFFGTVAKVDIVWYSIDLVIAGLLALNFYGLLYLLPQIRAGFKAHSKQF